MKHNFYKKTKNKILIVESQFFYDKRKVKRSQKKTSQDNKEKFLISTLSVVNPFLHTFYPLRFLILHHAVNHDTFSQIYIRNIDKLRKLTRWEKNKICQKRERTKLWGTVVEFFKLNSKHIGMRFILISHQPHRKFTRHICRNRFLLT